ncbi:MAG TPA: hypothetical protein VMF91_04710 [Bryobacteraceae bacterium]|nr:hypothetical protein [Bryobacteraceae bacterium]
MASISPNRYVAQSSDGKTKVEYETSTFVGLPALNLTEGPGPIRHFSGSQVRVLDTEIGTLVTVTTRITVDTGSTSFSILIPSISLKSVSDQEAFETEAIITTHSGPISIPFNGVHEKYQFIPLKGEASFVLSLLQQVTSAAGKAAGK